MTTNGGKVNGVYEENQNDNECGQTPEEFEKIECETRKDKHSIQTGLGVTM